MGGIFVRTDRLEEVGSQIFVDLVKPGWKRQLTVTARITSRVDAIDSRLSNRMPGMGLQFIGLDEKQRARLLSLLRELGAPEEDLQVTLPGDGAQGEAQTPAPHAEPLDPQPQPPWQRARTEESESRVPSLVEDIEGALREANLPAPGPVQLQEPPKPPKHVPDTSMEAKLMLQIRGLVMQLSDAQQQLSQRDLEIERLKGELETIRGALERSMRKT